MKILMITVTKGLQFLSSGENKSSTGASYYPYIGLLYVAASLEDEGHKVVVIDYYNEEDPEKKIQKSLTSVDAVGFSVYTGNYTKLASIANTIKKINPKIPIIIGGPHCTFHPDKALLDVPAADISIEGEAELTIKEVVKALNGEKKLSEISGVYYRKNGVIKKGKPAKIIEDLDSVSFPARHLVEHYEYGKISGISFYKPKFTTIMTSRGCPFRCRFCTRHVATIKAYRERSVENVSKELEEINDKYGSVMIVDDNFTANKKRVHKIMDWIIESGTELDLYVQGARVDSAERMLFQKMKKAGVKHIYFGIESGNQDVLDFYNKKTTIAQIRKAVNLSREMDFFTMGAFILGAPIETEHHIEKTMKFACSLPLDVVAFSPLCYQYGTDLWFEAVDQGIITQEDGYGIYPDKRRGLGNFTTEELVEFSKKAFERFYRRPTYIIQQIIRGIRRKNLSLLKIGLGYL